MVDDYRTSGFFKNGHFNTLYAHLLAKVELLPFSREHMPHPLGFSLYIDWVKVGHEN